jgi:hypothetical protein
MGKSHRMMELGAEIFLREVERVVVRYQEASSSFIAGVAAEFSFSVLFSAFAGYFTFSSTIINYGGVEDFKFLDVGRADELIWCSRSEAAAMERI